MSRKNKNLVLESINMHGEGICVDFFQRSDGTFGFEEFRRDFEDGRGWFPIGFYGSQKFKTLAQAKATAENSIGWYPEEC